MACKLTQSYYINCYLDREPEPLTLINIINNKYVRFYEKKVVVIIGIGLVTVTIYNKHRGSTRLLPRARGILQLDQKKKYF